MSRRPRIRAVSAGDRAIWWPCFLLFASLGVLWSLVFPILAAPDEAAHAVKAVAVAHGDLSTTSAPVRRFFGLYPETDVHIPRGYARASALGACWANTPDQAAACARQNALPSRDGPVAKAQTYVGTYLPVYYAVVGWPSRLLGPDRALYAMRIVSALVCAALLASGLTSAIVAGRGRLLVAAAALGITPLALTLAASINPNGVEIAAAFCVWLSVLALGTGTEPISRRLVLRTAVASLVLVTARPLSPLVLGGIVVVVALAVWDRRTPARLWADRSMRAAIVVTGVVALGAAAYTIGFQSASTLIQLPLTGTPSHLTIARTSLRHSAGHLQGMVALPRVADLRALQFPGLLVPGWTIVVALVAVVALILGSWRQRLVLAALAIGIVALPVVAETVSALKYGYAWQGRYALPLAVGLPILSGWIIDRSGALSVRVERIIGVALALYVAIGYLVAELSLMAFDQYGGAVDWIRGAEAGGWVGPLTPPVLAAWAGLTSAALAAWLIALTCLSAPEPSPS